jgi:hypothetical protein
VVASTVVWSLSIVLLGAIWYKLNLRQEGGLLCQQFVLYFKIGNYVQENGCIPSKLTEITGAAPEKLPEYFPNAWGHSTEVLFERRWNGSYYVTFGDGRSAVLTYLSGTKEKPGPRFTTRGLAHIPLIIASGLCGILICILLTKYKSSRKS